MSRTLGWAALAALAVAVPMVTANTYYLYLAMTAAVFVIVACGLNILAGLTGQISLGHAGLYAIGAYTAALAATRLGLGLLTALSLAIILTAVIGGGLALAALRVSGPYLAMVTIAFGIIVEGALVEWVSLTGGPGGIFDIPKPALAGRILTLPRYYLVVALAAALALWLTRNLMGTAWGRAFLAVKGSELAAESLGLSTYRVRTVAFTLSAAFAGAGGGLFAFLNGYLSPDSFTLQASILFLLIVLFGGLGTLAGPLVGAVALVLLPEVISGFVEYRLILYGTLLLLSVYFLPRGVVGLAVSRLSRDAPAGTASSPAPSRAEPAVVSLAEPVLVLRGEPATSSAEGGDRRPIAVESPAMAALEVVGVRKVFGGVVAVAEVSFRVDRATVHSLIGPNGAGKTTVVNVISGFAAADGGTVRLFGESIDGEAAPRIAQRGLVRTFQTPQVFEELSVRDNVRVGAAGHRLGSLVRALLHRERGAGDARTEESLAIAGLVGWADVPASVLPFGHRRRLEIARALAASARVLVLDEPAAGLAPGEIDDLAAMLARLRGDGLTILLVEHHVDMVMAVSDRVTVLDEGRVIADGRPATIQQDRAVLAAYLGTEA